MKQASDDEGERHMTGQAIHWLDAMVQAWSQWMWGISLHVTWLVALLWLLERPLARRSARLRFALWSLVLARLVISPTFMLPTGVGWWCGDWITQQTEAWSPAPPALATIASLDEIANLDSAHDSTLDSSLAVSNTGPQPTFQWSTFAFTLWLGFVVAQMMWLLLGYWQVRRWLAHSQPITDQPSLDAFAKAKQKTRITRAIGLRDSGMCATPLVVGCWRPVILLPTSVREHLNAAELETVLVHELTHIARRDGWWRLLQATLGALYFFHPAVWLARFKFNQYCEEACDELTVLALSGVRRNYAQAIVKAAAIVGYQPPYLANAMVGGAGPVKRRLQRILDPSLNWNSGGSARRTSFAMLLAFLLLPCGYRATEARLSTRLPVSSWPSLEDVETAMSTSHLPFEVPTESSVAAFDDEAETQALEQLKSIEFETRMAAYRTLESIGTVKSLSSLEAAFLNRQGIEQDAAKRALDHVWNVIRQSVSDPNRSHGSSRLLNQTRDADQ